MLLQGKIKLPSMSDPPTYLKWLMEDIESSITEHFRENIRLYNSMFFFTSMGGKVDKSINQIGGPYIFRLSSVNFH